jgi:hypothetical protein
VRADSKKVVWYFPKLDRMQKEKFLRERTLKNPYKNIPKTNILYKIPPDITKLLISIRTITRLIFTQIKHPLAIGLMLLIQTTIVCIIRGTKYKRFWFSYILFIIIIGGMLVLFIYITRLASNEVFSPSNKILITTLILCQFNLLALEFDI